MSDKDKAVTPGGVTLLAPAKINLFLRVLNKRADGFHDIHSLMQPVSLFDELTVALSDGDLIEVDSDCAHAPGGRGNLAYRAALAVLDAVGVRKSVRISIKKKIPVGAGLGGGSSDAATVLMALNDMLGSTLDEERLRSIGAGLGSDVPFFILKGSAIATGRGEVLQRVDIPAYDYVLINPGFPLSTARVYGNLSLTKNDEDNILSYSGESLEDVEKLKDCLVNDLERVSIALHPEISVIKDALLKEGAAGALMSGSGPTVFGLFSSSGLAKRAFDALSKSLPGVAGLLNARLFLVHGLGKRRSSG